MTSKKKIFYTTLLMCDDPYVKSPTTLERFIRISSVSRTPYMFCAALLSGLPQRLILHAADILYP